MKKKTYLIITCVLLITFTITITSFIVNNDIWDKNGKLFKNEVLAIESNLTETTLNKLTPFDWDEAYIFKPYSTKEYIYNTVGYEWDHINEIVDGMIQVVFLKNKEVVCYLTGYPNENKYDINIPINKFAPDKSHILLLEEDNPKLKIEKKNNITILTIL